MNNIHNIIDNIALVIYDINNISPRTNAWNSNKLGLYFLNMKRANFITHNLILYNKDKYSSYDNSNIVNIYNDSNNNYEDNKEELYKFYYTNTQIELTKLTKEILKIIEQQKNKIILIFSNSS